MSGSRPGARWPSTPIECCHGDSARTRRPGRLDAVMTQPHEEDVVLIPEPQRVSWGRSRRRIGRLEADPLPAVFGSTKRAIAELVAEITGDSSGEPAALRWVVDARPPESYELEIKTSMVTVTAGDPLGALHAIRTLCDVFAQTTAALPDVVIEDWPTLPRRGLFIESVWGTDRMGLDDWKLFIDGLGRLKFNLLAISLYGCWDLRHEGDSSEFLFVPLRRYPELRTPHHIRTWDPASESEVEYDYLPRMFEEQSFANVARYANDRGFLVVPFFGGPAHSSLIPRRLPEMSAVDELGRPRGYGYCVTRPAARTALSELLGDVVEEHVVPNGLTHLGCGGDEFYPIVNLDPADPLREIPPTCACETCRELTAGEQLVEYFLLAATVLAARGITMVVWHDSLVRLGMLDRLASRLEDAGLKRPIVSWWKYNDPLPDFEPAGYETWVTPAPAIIGSLFVQDRSQNIDAWVRRGVAKGAAGVMAYHVPDRAFHRSHAILADLAWRGPERGRATAMKRRWARRVTADDSDLFADAMAAADTVLASYPLMTHLLDHLLPYLSTSPRGVMAYPIDQVGAFLSPSPAMASVLRQTRDTLSAAVADLPQTESVPGWGDPGRAWLGEIVRLRDHVRLFHEVVELARVAGRLTDADLAARIADLEREGMESMRGLASTKDPWQASAALREHWLFISRIDPTVRHFREVAPDVREPWHAWII